MRVYQFHSHKLVQEVHNRVFFYFSNNLIINRLKYVESRLKEKIVNLFNLRGFNKWKWRGGKTSWALELIKA